MDNIDFSAFSKDAFDPVVWLNSIFSSTDHNDNDNDSSTVMDKKSIANNLVFKLQLMVEETNHSLQEISQRMSLSMPKVMDEADALNQEVKELRDQIVDVRTKLICSEQQHADVLESLMKMDNAKRQLQDLYQALQEANNWSVLSMDVDEVFETGDIEQISMKISSMQKSLELLSLSSSDGSQLTDKIEIMENLKDRFEKLVEPMLMDAFAKSSESSIEFFSNLFKEFRRSDRLIKYYHSCLRDELLKEWSTQVKLDSEGTVLDKLNFLYDRINMIWKIQMNFCMKVIYPEDFGMSLQILCDIFTDIIMSLQPPIDTFIHQFLHQTNGQRLYRQKSLIELKQFTNSFVKNLEQNICSQYSADEEHMNESHTNKMKSLDIFLRTIYQPFAKLNESFVLYEKERMDDEFDNMHTEYEDLINSHCVLKLFSLVRDSYKLYSEYVETYPLLIVEDVIEDLLLKYLNSTNNKKQWLLHDINDTKKTNTTSIQPNWSCLQKTLFKFQTYGDFVNQFHGFLQQIHSNFLEYQKNYHQQQQRHSHVISPFRRYDLFILNLDYNTEFRDRIENFIQTPSTLMNQVLNECIDLIKINAKDIDQAMFNYVQIQLNNFDIFIEKSLAEHDTVDNIELDESTTYTPNEYVTQIGQYLLLLPQHLEPFNLNENSSFKVALQYCTDIFRSSPNESIAPTELLLEFVQRKTIQSFLDHIQNISMTIKSKRIGKLPVRIRKQIAIDVSYLLAVCEDLGLINPPEAVICIRILNQQPEFEWSVLKKENPIYQKLIITLEDILA
ncbi:Golgi transport complex subunit 7 [Dermatophagoides farinae]|uniref:Conserved oligomeric Golgi complex subunit 7 n=1 Tax=Dermatophagoides farinae TaxID=6954 RepID=A0A922IA83_DERFA|nr:Golgi transport complex subunit 7 [Dermatophagoides farinae]